MRERAQQVHALLLAFLLLGFGKGPRHAVSVVTGAAEREAAMEGSTMKKEETVTPIC